jgi:putative membrane protein insertion efficiency factor
VTTTHDTDDHATPAPARRAGPVARVLLVPVNFYRRWISPVLPPSCRFEPSCSAYAVEALSTHGALRGSWLTVRRLLRCGPWHPGGYDPVPPRSAQGSTVRSASSANEEDLEEPAGAGPEHHTAAKE